MEKYKAVETEKSSHCSKSQPTHHTVPTSCVTAKMMGYGWHFDNRHSAHHLASEMICNMCKSCVSGKSNHPDTWLCIYKVQHVMGAQIFFPSFQHHTEQI